MSENKILLSILIPTVFGREEQLSNLLKKVNPFNYWKSETVNYGDIELYKNSHHWVLRLNEDINSIVGYVEVISLKDNKEMTIGEKREKLYQMATGTHSLMIDDDDDIAPNAIRLILEAIKSNPNVDCVTFQENCQMNGKYYKSNHSLEYPDWYGDGSHPLHDGFHYHRTPFYKDVIKTDIAKSVPFVHCRYGEDHLWSIDLYPHLKTEIHIDRELYYYIYEPKDTNEERYGLNTK